MPGMALLSAIVINGLGDYVAAVCSAMNKCCPFMDSICSLPGSLGLIKG
jgi:hypothetical protein